MSKKPLEHILLNNLLIIWLSFDRLLKKDCKRLTDFEEVCREYNQAKTLNLGQKLTMIFSDFMFNVPVWEATEKLMENNDVYLMKYSYESKINMCSLFSAGKITDLGVSHFDEDLLLFPNKMGIQPSQEDLQVVRSMWKMYHEFARTGQPKYGSLDIPKADPDNDVFLEVKAEPEIKAGFKPGSLSFWRSTQGISD